MLLPVLVFELQLIFPYALAIRHLLPTDRVRLCKIAQFSGPGGTPRLHKAGINSLVAHGAVSAGYS